MTLKFLSCYLFFSAEIKIIRAIQIGKRREYLNVWSNVLKSTYLDGCCYCHFLFSNVILCQLSPKGFDQGEDIQLLQAVMPNIDKNLGKYLYLQEFWKELQKLKGFEFEYPTKPGSLSDLTYACFGVPLNKFPTMSVWSKFPLDQYQVEYAALDAIILIRIFKKICETLKPLKTDVVKYVEDFIEKDYVASEDETNEPMDKLVEVVDKTTGKTYYLPG